MGQKVIACLDGSVGGRKWGAKKANGQKIGVTLSNCVRKNWAEGI